MTAMPSPATLRVSSRVYTLLLRAYPEAFRREYGIEMVRVFRDTCRDALNEQGKLGVISLWLHTVLDLSSSALRERLIASGYKGAYMIDTTEFDSQIVSTFEYWSKALRAGYNVKQASEFVAQNAPEPTATAFRRFLEDVEGGTPWDEAFANLQQRVPSRHLGQFVEVMLRQRKEGGNLADKIDAVRERIQAEAGTDGWSRGLGDEWTPDQE